MARCQKLPRRLRLEIVIEYSRLSALRYQLLDDAHDLEDKFHLFNVDHSDASFEAMRNVLQSDTDREESTPFYKLSHVDTFRSYFEILDQLGVRVFSTLEDSVISDAGAEFRPLSELL